MLHRLMAMIGAALLASAALAQTPTQTPTPLEPIETGEGDTPSPAAQPAAAPRSVVIPAASLVPQEPEAPPSPAPPPPAPAPPAPPAAPALPPPPPPPPPVDPAIAAFGFWGGIAESSWASQDGRTFFAYRWNPRHDAVLAEIYDGSIAGRRSVVYREPVGDGLRIETTFSDGRKVAGAIVEPDDVTAIQSDPARPEARTVYHRASPANVLVEQQTRQADATWLTTKIDSRHRIAADDRVRLVAADRARIAAAPPPPPVPVDATPEEKKRGLIGRIGGVFGGRKDDPAPAAPPPPPVDDPS
jgi:hypothetical protein